MAKITKIKLQRNKKRVNLYLDGKFALPFDADDFLKAGLKVGQEISAEEINKLRNKDLQEKLYNRGLKFLSYRPRSEKELRSYLSKKIGASQNSSRIIRVIIEKLKSQRLLSDIDFARWWLEQRATFRPRGKFGLKAELKQKGIDEKLAEKVIEEKVDELVLAKKAVQKKMKAYKRLGEREFREKMAAFLFRRGFSWETIKLVLAAADRVKRGKRG